MHARLSCLHSWKAAPAHVQDCRSGDRSHCRTPKAKLATLHAFIVRFQITRRRALQVLAAGTVSTNDFKNGLTVEIDGQPFRVMGAQLYRSSFC